MTIDWFMFLNLLHHGKILLHFFHWQNHIRPLLEQCAIREFDIEMSLSMV